MGAGMEPSRVVGVCFTLGFVELWGVKVISLRESG